MTTVIEQILYPAALLCGWSLMYRDNPFWRFFESALVGMGTSITLKVALDVIINQQITPILEGSLYPSIIGLLFGLLVLTRLVESTKEYSYIPFALMTGVGAAVGAQGAVGAQILKQTVFPSFVAGDAWTSFNNILLFLATLTTMCYFVFSIKKGAISGPIYGVINALGKIGRYAMMVGFGVTLSGFYIGTGTSLIVYSDYLFSDVGKYVTGIGLLILIGGIYYTSRQTSEETTSPEIPKPPETTE